ncbi:MAG: TrmO family methyltransferase [Methanobrevibacter sp.]|nr:TrmO family methyltransferase [Candidatus Methanoflexus mossambicus]
MKGEVHINEKYKKGLEDLEGFSHISLIYQLHKVNSYNLKVKPFLDNSFHGIFTNPSSKRTNPIRLSVVKLNES